MTSGSSEVVEVGADRKPQGRSDVGRLEDQVDQKPRLVSWGQRLQLSGLDSGRKSPGPGLRALLTPRVNVKMLLRVVFP